MLIESLKHLLTPCPKPWREMGYLREQIAIDARFGRNRTAWQPHLEASKKAILDGAKLCPRKRCALIIGAGLHHDLPLAELAGTFERVVLGDLVHRPFAKRAASAFGSGVHCVEFDVSGVLMELHRSAEILADEQAFRLVSGVNPGLPVLTEGEPDLVVSAGVCSQIMLLPAAWMEKYRARYGDFADLLQKAGARRHLDWIRERTGVQVLITDIAKHEIDSAGIEKSSAEIVGLDGLRPPDRSWRWRLAPIPERNRDLHIEHTVGAWIGKL